MNLQTWRLARQLSLSEAARLFGAANGKVVQRWETGECVPRREAMCRIYQVTAGEVTPNTFYDLSEPAAA